MAALRFVAGNVDVNTLASKRSELIGNAEILRMRRVIHNHSTCVCLRIPVAAITQKRKNASVDLWPALRWMAAFLLDRMQRVKIGNNYSYRPTGHPNGGVTRGTICGPKCFMVYINYLPTQFPLYLKYVDDSTLFEICEMNCISLMQESVNIATKWTNNNDMKINPEKSIEMLISYAHSGNLGAEYTNVR